MRPTPPSLIGLSTLVTAVASMTVSTPASAHHSFAMFDQTRTLQANVVVRRIEWSNPHAYMFFTVPGKTGPAAQLAVECGSISLLARKGWKFNSVGVGDSVTLSYHPFKDGRSGGMLVSIGKQGGVLLKG